MKVTALNLACLKIQDPRHSVTIPTTSAGQQSQTGTPKCLPDKAKLYLQSRPIHLENTAEGKRNPSTMNAEVNLLKLARLLVAWPSTSTSPAFLAECSEVKLKRQK